MNIDVHYPHADPGKSKLSGTVKTRGIGFRLAAQNLTITEGDGDIELAGNTVKLKGMTLKANDQKMSLSGQVTNFREPTARLQAKSPNLNVDRLLVPAKSKGTASEAQLKALSEKAGTPKTGEPAKTEEPAKKKASKSELPPSPAQTHCATAGRGDPRTVPGAKISRFYAERLLRAWGAQEPRVPCPHWRWPHPNQRFCGLFLRNRRESPLPLNLISMLSGCNQLASLLDTDKISVHAPLTMTGRLQGRTGSTKDLLASLRGNLEAEAGPGRIPDIGPAGNALFKLLSFVNVQQIFSRNKFDDMAKEGIPFDSLTYQATFQDGTMGVNKLRLLSPALYMDVDGNIYLVKQRLDMNAEIEFMGPVDKVLGLVPILGKSCRKTNPRLSAS